MDVHEKNVKGKGHLETRRKQTKAYVHTAAAAIIIINSKEV